MKTTPTPHRIPLTLLLAPRVIDGQPLALAPGIVSPYPESDVKFIGWGGIRGPDEWPDRPDLRASMARMVMSGVASSGNLKPHERRIVIGCERRNQWLKENPTRYHHIDALLRAIYRGMKAVHGLDVEVSFSGPEDAIEGANDCRCPMIGAGGFMPVDWEKNTPLVFTSLRYGADASRIARVWANIARTSGFNKRRPVWWIQDEDPKLQTAELALAKEALVKADRLLATMEQADRKALSEGLNKSRAYHQAELARVESELAELQGGTPE